MRVRILPCAPIDRVKLVQKSPALGTPRPRGGTSHPDQHQAVATSIFWNSVLCELSLALLGSGRAGSAAVSCG